MILSFLFGRKKRRKVGEKLYSHIRQAARNPVFFGKGRLPDTVDGRFELLTLHAFLLMRALRIGAPDERFDQLVFDAMFRDLDDALREMGISDTRVGKKIKQMAAAFYGRCQSYHEALENSEPGAIQAALLKNALATAQLADGEIFSIDLAQWLVDSSEELAKQSPDQILDSGPAFANIRFADNL